MPHNVQGVEERLCSRTALPQVSAGFCLAFLTVAAPFSLPAVSCYSVGPQLSICPACYGAFWSHKRDTFKAGRVKPRCASLKSRFPPAETLPGSAKSQLCWGEDESLTAQKTALSWEIQEIPSIRTLSLLATTCPEEKSAPGAEVTPISWTS